MSQLSFASLTPKKKQISTENFLNEMNQVIPWNELLSVIQPYYYSGKAGRKPMKLELMLRIYFLQQWFNLGDPTVEEAIYDRLSFQRFLEIDLMVNVIPDETTILNFRHLIEEHNLTMKILAKVNSLLQKKGVLLKQGTIVDATLIKAPSSTKNKEGKRDKEMSSTKKNNQWHFGMKMHIGVDSRSGLIHTCDITTAKVSDRDRFSHLLHGNEIAVFGDKGYVSDRDKHFARNAGIYWGVLDKKKPGKDLSKKQEKNNKRLSKLRSKVEHPFQVIKHLWGHTKTRFKGIAKNATQFYMLACLFNLYRVRKTVCF
jgi:transposase, IS5 family